MSTPLLLYIASVFGAIALILMMPRPNRRLAPLGALIGAAALGGIWLALAAKTSLLQNFSEETLGMPGTAFIYFYVFSGLAIVSAVRVITQRKPVYSALWFVMVVLASSGLFLVLSADFMAFAMVLIYGGAILVTYMFVIMLATQPDDPANDPTGSQKDYDKFGSEPLWACVAAFLLLAVLLSVFFDHASMVPNADMAMATDAEVIATTLNDRALTPENSDLLSSSPTYTATRVSNVERIGLDLFQSHPLAIELAGVILLVSLIGAVVIAKTHVEHEFHPGSIPPTPEDDAPTPHVNAGPVAPTASSSEGTA